MTLYKYRSFENFEYLVDILVNQRLYCPTYKNLNDPFEGLFYSSFAVSMSALGTSALGSFVLGGGSIENEEILSTVDSLLLNVNHTRVCSLSASLSDVRLWSLYAGGHTGVAVAINFSSKEDINKVTYSENLPKFGAGLLASPYHPKEVLSCKTNHWAYEEEYRIISDSEYFPIKGKIEAIYVGNRIESGRLELIQKLSPNTPIIKTKINEKSISVEASSN